MRIAAVRGLDLGLVSGWGFLVAAIRRRGLGRHRRIAFMVCDDVLLLLTTCAIV